MLVGKRGYSVARLDPRVPLCTGFLVCQCYRDDTANAVNNELNGLCASATPNTRLTTLFSVTPKVVFSS